MRFRHALLGAAAVTLAGGQAAVAQGADAGWRVAVEPYVWLPSISGKLRYDLRSAAITSGGEELRGTADVKVDSGDYLSNLNGALLVAGEVRYDRFSVITDLLYMNIGGASSKLRSIDVAGIPSNPISSQLGSATSTDVKGFNWTLAAGYTVASGPWGNLDVLGGFRWFRAEVDSSFSLNLQLAGPAGAAGPSFGGTGRLSGSEDFLNGIIGVRGRARLGQSGFFVPYYLDIGAGDSNFTWQGFTGIGYQTGWAGVALGWRYMSMDQGSKSLVADLALSGAYLAATFNF